MNHLTFADCVAIYLICSLFAFGFLAGWCRVGAKPRNHAGADRADAFTLNNEGRN